MTKYIFEFGYAWESDNQKYPIGTLPINTFFFFKILTILISKPEKYFRTYIQAYRLK